MDSIGSAAANDEIERLYDELDDSKCECSRAVFLASCDFHKKLVRLKDLHDKEIEVIERSVNRLRTSIAKTIPFIEEMDAGFDDVLK